MNEREVEAVARAIAYDEEPNEWHRTRARNAIAALDRARRDGSVSDAELRAGIIERLALPNGRVHAVKYARTVRPWGLKEALEHVTRIDGQQKEGDGWQLVPKEPTREMWAAAGNVLVNSNNQHHDTITRAVWDGMLAAAPLPGDGK